MSKVDPYIKSSSKKEETMTLRELRDEYKMSQKQLAKMLGVSRQAIGSWENGDRNPTFLAMQRLARIFDRTYQEIEAMFVGG